MVGAGAPSSLLCGSGSAALRASRRLRDWRRVIDLLASASEARSAIDGRAEFRLRRAERRNWAKGCLVDGPDSVDSSTIGANC